MPYARACRKTVTTWEGEQVELASHDFDETDRWRWPAFAAKWKLPEFWDFTNILERMGKSLYHRP